MEPQFVTLPEMKIVGLGTRFISILSPNKNNTTVIPPLWKAYMAKRASIPQKTGGADFGLIEMLPLAEQKTAQEGELFYIAGTQVSDFDGTPADLLQRTMPAGEYACFTHVGFLDGLHKTVQAIYIDWLPASGMKLRDTPHLERYDERFNPGSPDSEFDILLPIK